MKITRRYVECFVFVAVWVTCGWLFRPSLIVYQLLGIPWLVFFQVAVARRPLPQLWVRDPGAFRLDRAGAAVTAILILVAVAAIVRQSHPWIRVVASVLAIIGAFPAAFALRRQGVKQLREALPAFAAAVVIGCASLVAIALHDGRSPVLGLAKLLLLGPNSLWLFAMLFVIEEVVFRGALDMHVAPIPSGGKQAWVSAVFVSALWGLWHLPLCLNGTLYNLVTTFAISVVLGVPLSFCWRRSGTLVLPAAAHALIDGYRNVIFFS
jgi:hypothetical protein